MTATVYGDIARQLRFRYFAETDGEKIAVVDPDGTRWTRRQIDSKVNRLSRALRAHGMGAASTLALMAPNGAEFLIVYLAATQIGMFVVPVNWHLAFPEIQHILQDSSAMTLVTHSRFQAAIGKTLQQTNVRPKLLISLGGAIPGFQNVEDITSDFSDDPIADVLQGRVLSYTSATTGRPKGVILPIADADRALTKSIAARILAGTLPEVHVQLCASMLYHGAPLEGAVIALHMGHTVILLAQPEPEDILQAIEKYLVTMAYIVPSMFPRLLAIESSTRDRYSRASLRKVLHAGAACPIEIKRRMIEWWGPILLEAYGATEGAGTIVTSEEWLKYPGTVGRPMAGSRLRIIGDDGSDLPHGTVGTIYLTRYSGDRFEYLNDPEKTRQSYLGEFFTVGDMGYVNDEGFLFLSGRTIDVINLSGTKVYPAELEGLICEHPDVVDCAVIGVPDGRLGEAIMAVICPVSRSRGINELRRELVLMLKEHVSISKIPRYFEYLEAIPRDASGKVQKRELRERYSVRFPAT